MKINTRQEKRLASKAQKLLEIKTIKTAKDVLLYNFYKSEVIKELETVRDRNNPVILEIMKILIEHQNKLRIQKINANNVK